MKRGAMELNVRAGKEMGQKFPAAGSNQHTCSAHITGGMFGYYCTRADKHEGPHVAHSTDGTAMAAWGHKATA